MNSAEFTLVFINGYLACRLLTKSCDIYEVTGKLADLTRKSVTRIGIKYQVSPISSFLS